MARIEWSKRSQRELQEIYKYIEQSSPLYAARFVDRLMKRIEKLANFPFSGEKVPFKLMPDLRQIVFGKYRIFFQSNNDLVLVTSIFHASRLLTDEDFLTD